jgi:DNA-binding response OmpR family regulator
MGRFSFFERSFIQPQSRILLVEDEPAMSDALGQALTESGYQVQAAYDGVQGLNLAQERDLLIVDIMMPQMDGIEMVKRIREDGIRTPVLFLTAKDGLDDRVKGFDIGGDDYLVKPFKLAELLARIRALIRRARDGQDILQFADLWVDVRSRKARRGDRWMDLTQTEFSILELLMRQQGVPLSKRAILREVWRDEGYRDVNIVEVYVCYLRNKVDISNLPRLVQTVKGKGYMLALTDDAPRFH